MEVAAQAIFGFIVGYGIGHFIIGPILLKLLDKGKK